MRVVTHLLFVYGTLRRGESNGHLLERSEYLGKHTTDPIYTMFSFGPYPAIVAGGATAITGEVYAVDAATLARLDRFEEYPEEYMRNHIATPFGMAWVYVYRLLPKGASLIISGDWCSH